ELEKIKEKHFATRTLLDRASRELDELKTRAGPLLEVERLYETASRTRRRNDQLEREELLDKLAAITFEKDSARRKLRAALDKCAILREVPPPILDALHTMSNQNVKNTENILLLAAKAISSGKLSRDQWVWDFLRSQLQFYAVTNFRGVAARSVFTENVRQFWYEFALRFGERAYTYLQGKGFE